MKSLPLQKTKEVQFRPLNSGVIEALDPALSLSLAQATNLVLNYLRERIKGKDELILHSRKKPFPQKEEDQVQRALNSMCIRIYLPDKSLGERKSVYPRIETVIIFSLVFIEILLIVTSLIDFLREEALKVRRGVSDNFLSWKSNP